jgi:signal transduction histidine kinase
MKTETGSDAFIPLGDLLTIEEPVWIWDALACRILWANRSGRVFWGADSLDQLRAKRFSPRSTVAVRLKFLASKADNPRDWTEELTLSAASGRVRVKCSLQGLQVAGGRPGFVVKALDIDADRSDSPSAARKKTNAAKTGSTRPLQNETDQATLRAIAKHLKKSSKRASVKASAATPDAEMLARAVRELGHELGNPLNVIRGFASWIKEIAPPGPNQERLRAYADNILESTDLAMAVFGNFSARLAIEKPGLPDNPPAEIRSVVESCLRLVAPLAKDSGVKLYRRIDGNLPMLIIGGAGLKQILLNLLINATRYHKTGKQIKITARKRKDGAIRLTVADDGKGMTKKEVRAAMSKEHPVPLSSAGPSGVGLPLVKRLVETAGGELGIESARGHGTTISIVFPPSAQHAV